MAGGTDLIGIVLKRGKLPYRKLVRPVAGYSGNCAGIATSEDRT